MTFDRVGPQRRAALARLGAVAAAAGGASWTVKALAILATGRQPPLLFEIAPLFFAGGLIGLRLVAAAHAGRAGRIGGWIASVALLLAVADLLVPQGATSEETFSPLTFLTFLLVLLALVLLGVPTWRRMLLERPAHRLPLLLGALTFPAVAVGGALATFDERLLEVPLAILGLVWLWFGAAIWRAATERNVSGVTARALR